MNELLREIHGLLSFNSLTDNIITRMNDVYSFTTSEYNFTAHKEYEDIEILRHKGCSCDLFDMQAPRCA